ncbi:MAG: FAD-dependent oxidoreductase [Elusimicrobia bacterium]|nr:FAD-dependent oxidoreductase [Elusimicrobiota bacterium]
MAEKFEAVVVGCGPAGAAAALELAKNGVQVLVLDRARVPGGKNVTGGILYGQNDTPYNLDYVLPEFEKEAPLERRIRKYFMHAISGNKVRRVDLTELHEYNTKFAWSVLRTKFDAWLSQKVHLAAKKTGGGLISGVRVSGLVLENGRIAGVETSELEPIHAEVVIAADGATSELVRQSKIRNWMEPSSWFQGVKAVLSMSQSELERIFNVSGDEGVAHLYAGNLFGNARGGGFLYTNKDTLSIGTVFHLDSVVSEGLEPHRYLDRLLAHPVLAEMLADRAREVEYSAKLIPDGKKAFIERPYKDRMLVIGDAANQMLAAGPIIKGMNLGITAGILAAKSYVEAKKRGDLESVGARYAQALSDSYIRKSLEGNGLLRSALSILTSIGEGVAKTSLFSSAVKSPLVLGQIEGMLKSYRLSESAPDSAFAYNTLPSKLAEIHGDEVKTAKRFTTLPIDERIARLSYDTDIGKPHIEVLDDTPQASGACVTACPVSARDSSRGCYSLVEQEVNGRKVQKVVLDTQPCVECGTCAVVGATQWEHPRGNKGVEYKFG